MFQTLLNHEVCHDQSESVTREDVVSTVDMMPIDAETSAWQYGQDPLDANDDHAGEHCQNNDIYSKNDDHQLSKVVTSW